MSGLKSNQFYKHRAPALSPSVRSDGFVFAAVPCVDQRVSRDLVKHREMWKVSDKVGVGPIAPQRGTFHYIRGLGRARSRPQNGGCASVILGEIREGGSGEPHLLGDSWRMFL